MDTCRNVNSGASFLLDGKVFKMLDKDWDIGEASGEEHDATSSCFSSWTAEDACVGLSEEDA